MPQVTDFQERVYALLLQIPSGRVTTYASLARALNTSPRAVGNALRNNPFAPSVPCHRCVAASGYINGFNGEVIQKSTYKRVPAKGSAAAKGAAKVTVTVTGKATQSKARGVKWEMEEQVKTVPPSGVNISKKLDLLKEEGVSFDDKGMLKNRSKVLFDGPWTV